MPKSKIELGACKRLPSGTFTLYPVIAREPTGKHMRLVMFAVLTAGLIASCATAKLGMTLADFASACRSAHIDGATGIPLSTGDLVVMCPIAGAGIPAYPQYQLFEEGMLKQLLPKDEVLALNRDPRPTQTADRT